jgi:hypothetical protein
MIRIAAAVVSLALAGAAFAAETPPPATATPEATPQDTVPVEKQKKKTRYVNAQGETLVCKELYGNTGTRLKDRQRLICGTQAQWDDANSEQNRYISDLTGNFRGNIR